jgi:hypothetical protein
MRLPEQKALFRHAAAFPQAVGVSFAFFVIEALGIVLDLQGLIS